MSASDRSPHLTATPLRCGAVWSVAGAAGLALLVWLWPDVAAAHQSLGRVGGGGPAPGFEVLLGQLLAVVAAGCVLWLWLITTVVVVEAAAGQGREHGLGPVAVRRAVLVACGVALTAGAVGPAHAVEVTLLGEDDRGPDRAEVVAGLPLPDRVTRDGRQRPDPTDRAVVAVPDLIAPTHRVRPGESLWSIAADALPTAASDAEITRRWQEIHALNRAVVGHDPALIHPGQELRLTEGGTR